MCLAGVANGILSVDFDARLVGEPDAEGQPIADRLLHRERLRGEHQRVSRPGRDDRGADLDGARCARPSWRWR